MGSILPYLAWVACVFPSGERRGTQVEAGKRQNNPVCHDHGVNYLDTGYEYHQGESEVIVGRALRDGYRERTNLATKLPLWRVKTIDDCRRILEEQLRRLQVEAIDFYLLHAVNAERWRLVQDLEICFSRRDGAGGQD